MKKIILLTLVLISISFLTFSNPIKNYCTITSQSFYVVPKKFNTYENAYEVHCIVSGDTNATSLSILSQGNSNIPEISIENNHFTANVIVSYYISPTPLFNTNSQVTVQANYDDGNTELFHYQTKTMQVLFNE